MVKKASAALPEMAGGVFPPEQERASGRGRFLGGGWRESGCGANTFSREKGAAGARRRAGPSGGRRCGTAEEGAAARQDAFKASLLRPYAGGGGTFFLRRAKKKRETFRIGNALRREAGLCGASGFVSCRLNDLFGHEDDFAHGGIGVVMMPHE